MKKEQKERLHLVYITLSEILSSKEYSRFLLSEACNKYNNLPFTASLLDFLYQKMNGKMPAAGSQLMH